MSNKDKNAVERLEQRTRPLQFKRTLILALGMAGAALMGGCMTMDSNGKRAFDPVKTERFLKVLETTSGVLGGIHKQYPVKTEKVAKVLETTSGVLGGIQSQYPVKTEKVAEVLETTISSGVLVGIQKQPMVAGYFRAVGSAACSFSAGTDLSPEALNAALQATTIREFKTVEAQLMVNSMVMAYSLAYADRARADVDANVYAKAIVDVLCKGIHNGVEQAKAQGLIRAAR
jgi:hypothetical protein